MTIIISEIFIQLRDARNQFSSTFKRIASSGGGGGIHPLNIRNIRDRFKRKNDGVRGNAIGGSSHYRKRVETY